MTGSRRRAQDLGRNLSDDILWGRPVQPIYDDGCFALMSKPLKREGVTLPTVSNAQKAMAKDLGSAAQVKFLA